MTKKNRNEFQTPQGTPSTLASRYAVWKKVCEEFDFPAGQLHDLFFKYVMTDRGFAANFLESYFPKWGEFFDFSKLEIVANEYSSQALGKKIADLVYLVPCREPGKRPLKISVVMEHKAQSGGSVDRHTIGNLVLYSVMQTLAPLRNAGGKGKRKTGSDGPIDTPQALAVLVYTGEDPNYDTPKWEEHFPLPDVFSEFAFHVKIPCVNLTRLLKEGALRGNPYIRAMSALLACGSTNEIKTRIKDWAEPLRDVEDWSDERSLGFLFATMNYVFKESVRLKNPFLGEDWNQATDIIEQTRRGLLKTYLDEVLEAREHRGELRGERNDIVDWLIEDYGPDANDLIDKINEISDLNVLKSIHRLMRRARVLEEIERGVDEILSGIR